jgi:hypothetical protein
MRKLFATLIAVLAVLALTTSATFAVGPTSITRDGGLHFVGSPDVTANTTATSSSLTATGEVAGAGPTASATLSAIAEVTRGCINRGSKDQEPSGLKRSSETATGSVEFRTRSGRGTFTVTTSEVTVAGFSCPDTMTPVLVSVLWTNITLTITSQTGSTTAYFPDISS